ncbi:MAG TPA: hypothetical protein VFG31_00200 [Conexibacter sp.]|nr:hypothetical protein [Conexibacter sp.]
MRNTAALVVVLAAAWLALLVSSASATEAVTFVPARSISASGTLTMTAEALSMRCPVTLSGSFNTGSLAVTRGTQWGSVSRFTWSACTGGELRTALSLPWPLRYRSLPGEYPTAARNVTLDLSGMALQGTIGGLTCLYSGTLGQQIGLSPERTYEEAWSTGSDTVLAEERLPLVSGALCPSSARISGTLSLTPQQQMQRFIGRLAIAAASLVIAAGNLETTVVMRNGSPNGSPSIRVNPIPLRPLELINGVAEDNAEMFRFVPGRDFCTTATLPADGVTTCGVDIRYEERAARPRTGGLRILPETNGNTFDLAVQFRAN